MLLYTEIPKQALNIKKKYYIIYKKLEKEYKNGCNQQKTHKTSFLKH